MTKPIMWIDQVGVVSRFGEVLVNPISATLYESSALTILGETGSGKSLFAQCLMGVLPKDLVATGSISHGEQKAIMTPERLSHLWGNTIAMLAQEPTLSLDPTMTLKAQVFESFYLVNHQTKSDALAQTHHLLETLGLSSFLGYYPHQLSGGMAQRAAFAVMLAGGAKIVIADEPTKGLDEHNRQIVINLLKQIPQNGGTLLTISHDIEVAEQLGGRVMVMKKGELLEEGTSQQVLSNPKSEYAHALVSAAPKNWQTPTKAPITTAVQVSLQDIAIKRGKKNTLISGLNLDIHQGEVVGIVGQSGIGKSSLGDVICGLLPPSQGRVVWTQPPKRHQLLKLYQDPPAAFAQHLPLGTLLDDVIKKHKLDKSRVPVLLEELSLNLQLLTRKAGDVSGGELQRIAILRALLLEPVLLFADEVTSRLDPITQKQTMDLLVNQCKQNNCTLIIISHDPSLGKYYCDKTIDLSDYTAKTTTASA